MTKTMNRGSAAGLKAYPRRMPEQPLEDSGSGSAPSNDDPLRAEGLVPPWATQLPEDPLLVQTWLGPFDLLFKDCGEDSFELRLALDGYPIRGVEPIRWPQDSDTRLNSLIVRRAWDADKELLKRNKRITTEGIGTSEEPPAVPDVAPIEGTAPVQDDPLPPPPDPGQAPGPEDADGGRRGRRGQPYGRAR